MISFYHNEPKALGHDQSHSCWFVQSIEDVVLVLSATLTTILPLYYLIIVVDLSFAFDSFVLILDFSPISHLSFHRIILLFPFIFIHILINVLPFDGIQREILHTLSSWRLQINLRGTVSWRNRLRKTQCIHYNQ